GVEESILLAGIAVRAPGPAGHGEDIIPRPFQTLPIDLGIALTLEHAVDRACGLAMRLRPFIRPQELRAEGHGRHHRPAGDRVDIFENDAVVRAAGVIAELL